jgi:hypothetical protein
VDAEAASAVGRKMLFRCLGADARRCFEGVLRSTQPVLTCDAAALPAHSAKSGADAQTSTPAAAEQNERVVVIGIIGSLGGHGLEKHVFINNLIDKQAFQPFTFPAHGYDPLTPRVRLVHG